MVVAGPEACECDAGEERGIRPSLPRVRERRRRGRFRGKRRGEAQKSHNGERCIGKHVESVWDSQPRATVRKEGDMREAVASAATSQRRARRRLPQEQGECAAWADGASYKKGGPFRTRPKSFRLKAEATNDELPTTNYQLPTSTGSAPACTAPRPARRGSPPAPSSASSA